ncbi:methyltransferase domain-containing protein [Bradyrhizobium sp. CSA112]|uniref:class I SAM-dependent methyltransferase n=1 Tax=Bradyrhizobium sp. CSA112 TaxID=2699170 RepID=UPI0023AFC2B6|nr:class I SAM-dependent methyltransferase [Bradyrhizobium sp. CSA112]MDE5457573.1 methyltransferase domain-containing protein [Bradyrhizobium sp. CSA112]
MCKRPGTFDASWAEFTGQGRNYDRYQPSYPSDVAKLVSQHIQRAGLVGGIADVGSGTGIFTRVLAREIDGIIPIIGVEPNQDMIQVAMDAMPPDLQVSFQSAPAEQLPFQQASLSALVFATAAHRFDRKKFFGEVARTVQPGGMLALVHNRHRYWDSDALTEFHSFIESCVPGYRRGTFTNKNGGYSNMDFRSELLEDSRFSDVEVRSWEWDFETNLEHFIITGISTSIVQRSAEVVGCNKVVEFLRDLFRRYSIDGSLKQPYVTEVTCAIVSGKSS